MSLTSTTPTKDIVQWYRDPVSCLQSTLATVLIHAGEEPLSALGLGWEFRHLSGDVRSEEFYWPCRYPDDLARSVLPYHDVTSRWHALGDADPLDAWEAALDRSQLPIVAVDNYHLPFRPAYHDVHAAHLVVVYDLDRDAGVVAVSDAMPPAFQGSLPVEDLLRSCRSENPPDHQDRFFTGHGVGGRWLEVRLGAPRPPLTWQRLRDALTRNLRRHSGDDDSERGPTSHWVGRDGLRRYRDQVTEAVHNADHATLGHVYTHGWSQQSQAALHGELLRRCGAQWGLPRLSEAGRRVEHVAHRWTAVRVTAAHGSAAAAPRLPSLDLLPHHVDRLRAAYEDAVAAIERAVGER